MEKGADMELDFNTVALDLGLLYLSNLSLAHRNKRLQDENAKLKAEIEALRSK